MSELASKQTFQFAGRGRTVAKPLTEEEHGLVNEELGKFASKTKAIEYLIKRGWSDQQISLKIRYESDHVGPDGKVYHRKDDPLRVQHINNTRAKMRG